MIFAEHPNACIYTTSLSRSVRANGYGGPAEEEAELHEVEQRSIFLKGISDERNLLFVLSLVVRRLARRSLQKMHVRPDRGFVLSERGVRPRQVRTAQTRLRRVRLPRSPPGGRVLPLRGENRLPR